MRSLHSNRLRHANKPHEMYGTAQSSIITCIAIYDEFMFQVTRFIFFFLFVSISPFNVFFLCSSVILFVFRPILLLFNSKPLHLNHNVISIKKKKIVCRSNENAQWQRKKKTKKKLWKKQQNTEFRRMIDGVERSNIQHDLIDSGAYVNSTTRKEKNDMRSINSRQYNNVMPSSEKQ